MHCSQSTATLKKMDTYNLYGLGLSNPLSPFFLFILNSSTEHTLLTVRPASTSSSFDGSFDFSLCQAVFDYSSPQRICDSQQSGILSSNKHHSHNINNVQSFYITFPERTIPLHRRCVLPFQRSRVNQPAPRAVEVGATESGRPRPGAAGQARPRGPRSGDSREGSTLR